MPAPESSTASPAFARIVSELRRAGCVFAEEEAELLIAEASDPVELEGDVRRRAAGIPLEYILGWAWFAGRRVMVEPGVFVPRRRTELLVNEAAVILEAAGASQPRVVLDLCCGSGAVAAALAMRIPGLELHAADIDPVAVRCARGNVEPMGGHVHEGDLFGALPLLLRGRVQVLAVNAPYVPTMAIRTMPPEARLHESRLSLDGGADGLDVHRRVAAAAPEWLGPAGHLLVETSEQQALATASIVSAAGFTVRIVRSEELDGTVVVGVLPDFAGALPR
jgi:release factor glutamine methyltransferase